MSPLQLWIGGYGPEESAHGAGLAAFRDHVVDGSDGEVAIEVTWNIMTAHPGGGRPNTDLLELVENGEMFLCYFSTSYLGPRVSELNILETPFLFSDLDFAHRCLDGRLGDRLRAAVRSKTGFDVLGFWDNGFRHMTNRLRPIHRPEDVRGMSVRIQPNPIHEELIRNWGGVPVAVELSEGIEMIESGTVDAQENPLANTVAYGVHQVHPHVTMTAHLYGARALLANRHVFEDLPDHLRDLVEDGARLAVATQRDAAARLETQLRHDMEKEGTLFVDPSAEERSAFESAAEDAIVMARDSVPADLFELVTD